MHDGDCRLKNIRTQGLSLRLASLVLVLLALAPAARAQSPGDSRPLVGAIRWDAWHGDRGVPGRAMMRSLGPERWQDRVPFFGTVVSTATVWIDGASQAVMDREIAHARQAGLDYWAFVTYPEDDPMSLGRKLYLSSTRRDWIKFCLIVEQQRWGHPSSYKPALERLVGLMREPTYQKVLGGRPLIYMLVGSEKHITAAWGTLERFGAMLGEFRAMARQAGLGDPYLVLQVGSPALGERLLKPLGADALGAYALHANAVAGTYAQLTAHAEATWDAWRAKGAPVVPLVMAGWDRRPRVQNPVPWETWQQPMVNFDRFYERATPEALGAHLSRALEWTRTHPAEAPARAVLIYAWNENDEGGWLVPTLGEGTRRVEALARVLRPAGAAGGARLEPAP